MEKSKRFKQLEVYFSLMQNNSVEINQGNDLTGQPCHQQPRLLLCSLTIPDEQPPYSKSPHDTKWVLGLQPSHFCYKEQKEWKRMGPYHHPFKRPSQNSHTTFLITYHSLELSYVVTPASREARKCCLYSQRQCVELKFGVLLLRKERICLCHGPSRQNDEWIKEIENIF